MTIQIPTLLSYERKIENSDGLMFSGKWCDLDKIDAWKPIPIVPRYNRSTQSACGTSDEDKVKPNPVSSSNDDANLPIDDDTLKLSFTLRVIGNLGKPFACNNPEFEEAITRKVGEFVQTESIDILAYRYAYNIANGRFLWRNRVGAEKIEVHVSINDEDKPLVFNAYDFNLNSFDAENYDIKKLSEIIKTGFCNDTFTFMQIDTFVKLGGGQHIFPSQEMNMGEKRRVLFKISDQAAMHNVKIGNALRTIDDWYKDAQFPIAVEPYGAVTQRGVAYRKAKIDLYTLLERWANDEVLEDAQQAYVVANLIRGGVFSKGGDQ